MTALDLADIQGFVVRGYRMPVASFLLLHVDDAAAGRRVLAGALRDVLSAAPWERKPDAGINVSLTFGGLAALGVPAATLATFPDDFREGMAARAEGLGDVGESAPAHWERPYGSGDVHALVLISAQEPAALAEHDSRLRALLDAAGGVRVIADQPGAALPDNREHFGFADGFSQPSIEGSGVDPLPGQGAPSGDGWRPLRAGEFILGYPDEEGVPPAAPAPDDLARNGSFLVYRKLHQDVAGFRRQLAAAARHLPGGEEQLAAKIVGRWRDGTPVTLSPEAPDAAIVRDEARNNAFSYADDEAGLRCPIGSHVRRANPRRGLPFEGKLVNRHRLIRRGITYGEPLPDGALEDDGQDRGVIFACLQASIARQFEFVQSQWLNDGNAFRLGDDQDLIGGPQDGPGLRKMTVPGAPPRFVGPLAPVITTRGGEYFFTPGLNGLRWLAQSG